MGECKQSIIKLTISKALYYWEINTASTRRKLTSSGIILYTTILTISKTLEEESTHDYKQL